MNYYAFSSPGAAINADGLRTEEVWRGYAESGLNTMMLTGKNAYQGEGWENSNTKKCFDIAKKVGIEKIIFDDMRLYNLIDECVGEGLVGENCRFQTESALDDFVRECMREYIHEEAFYGLRLLDEPKYKHAKNYGLVYRSIKRVAKELGKDYVFIEMNLFPLIGGFNNFIPTELKNLGPKKAYEEYLDAFMRETGANTLSVDNYPFRPNYLGGRFLEGYFSCLQMQRKKCDEYGAKMAFVMATFEMTQDDPEGMAGYRRIATVNEMFLHMNTALAFGTRDMEFYTYVTMAISSKTSPFKSLDGSSFITSNGQKTAIYSFAKAAIAHAKRLEKAVEAYDFKGANLYVDEKLYEIKTVGLKDNPEVLDSAAAQYLKSWPTVLPDGTVSTADFDNSYKMEGIENLSFDRDVLLATHFEKQGEAPDMYAFVNVTDRTYKTELAPMRVRVKFKGNVRKAWVLQENDFEEIEIKDGVFETRLTLGEAAWVIPMK